MQACADAKAAAKPKPKAKGKAKVKGKAKGKAKATAKAKASTESNTGDRKRGGWPKGKAKSNPKPIVDDRPVPPPVAEPGAAGSEHQLLAQTKGPRLCKQLRMTQPQGRAVRSVWSWRRAPMCAAKARRSLGDQGRKGTSPLLLAVCVLKATRELPNGTVCAMLSIRSSGPVFSTLLVTRTLVMEESLDKGGRPHTERQ